MTTETYIVTYEHFVVEGDNYAGWAGYREETRVIRGEKNMKKWMIDMEHWNAPELGNDPMKLLKVEKVGGLTDVTAKMHRAGKDGKVLEDKAERKRKAAQLRAEARKIERGE